MTNTLASHYDPADFHAPLIESPFFEELLPAAGLSPEEEAYARKLRQDGYAIVDFGFPADLIDRVEEATAAIPDGPGNRITNGWKTNGDIRALATHPHVMDLLTKLYGRPAAPFQTLNFKLGTEQAAHSDSIHFHTVPERFMCGVWVALEDIDADNGPLIYYPGSHKLPVVDMGHLLAPDGERGERFYQECYEPCIARYVEAKGLQPQEGHMKRGQALIWTANLFHGGAPRRDGKRTRMSQVTHFFFEGCSYYTPQHSRPGMGEFAWGRPVNLATGKPIDGFNPNMKARKGAGPKLRPDFEDERPAHAGDTGEPHKKGPGAEATAGSQAWSPASVRDLSWVRRAKIAARLLTGRPVPHLRG